MPQPTKTAKADPGPFCDREPIIPPASPWKPRRLIVAGIIGHSFCVRAAAPIDTDLSLCHNAIDCTDEEITMGKKTVQTLKDIARLANVSKSTVSRALNNSSLVNQETKERNR
jgi:hypothetical protein